MNNELKLWLGLKVKVRTLVDKLVVKIVLDSITICPCT